MLLCSTGTFLFFFFYVQKYQSTERQQDEKKNTVCNITADTVSLKKVLY